MNPILHEFPVYLALRGVGDERLIASPVLAGVLWVGGRCRIMIDAELVGAEPHGRWFQSARAERAAEFKAFLERSIPQPPQPWHWLAIKPNPEHQQEPNNDE